MSGCAEEQIIKWHAKECDDQATQVACRGVRRREDNTGGMRRSATTTRQHRWHAEECDDDQTTQVPCEGVRRPPPFSYAHLDPQSSFHSSPFPFFPNVASNPYIAHSVPFLTTPTMLQCICTSVPCIDAFLCLCYAAEVDIHCYDCCWCCCCGC